MTPLALIFLAGFLCGLCAAVLVIACAVIAGDADRRMGLK